MTHDANNCRKVEPEKTAHVPTNTPGISLDTGFTGRLPRGRYSKAYMLKDIASLADPRLWPVYVAGALMAAVLLFMLLKSIDTDPATVFGANAEAPVNAAWQTPEESMAWAAPRVGSPLEPVAPQLAATEERGKKQVAMFAVPNESILAAEQPPATTATAQEEEEEGKS